MSEHRSKERTIEGYLLGQCRAQHLLCLKFTSPTRGGVPDRVIVSSTKTVFVEVKRPGEKPTRRQLAVHAKMRGFGAEIHVVDDRAGVDALINELSASRR